MKAKLTNSECKTSAQLRFGLIDAENVTCLVGTNESGKTNLLLAL